MRIIIHVEPDQRGHWSAWAKTYKSGLGKIADEAIEDFLMKLNWNDDEFAHVEYFIDRVEVSPEP